VGRADFSFAPSDINGIRQENVRPGQVNFHSSKPMASWFETRGIAALLTMRV
jgi:hypothetical protein